MIFYQTGVLFWNTLYYELVRFSPISSKDFDADQQLTAQLICAVQKSNLIKWVEVPDFGEEQVKNRAERGKLLIFPRSEQIIFHFAPDIPEYYCNVALRFSASKWQQVQTNTGASLRLDLSKT